MASWDYFRQQFEAASAQAQAAASQASKLAEVVSAQASSYSAVAAERATDLGKAAADYSEGARTQLAGLHLPESLANLQLPAAMSGAGATSTAEEDQPSVAELETYGVTADFRDFIRSLTYSTFRDFPPDQIPPLSAISGATTPAEGQRTDMASYLNPWLARHAVLVCSTVKEMNELRFVLVPKRLTDEQFWSIYFALTRARLPKEAFDTSLQAPPEPPKPAAAAQNTSVFPSLEDLKIAVRPAAAPMDGSAAGKQDWLSALVCGFEVDIPIEKLQENTIVLGAGAAITSKLAQLQETARGLAVPADVRANISANLANARDLMGLGNGAAADATDSSATPADATRSSPARLAPIAEQPAGGGAAAAAAAADAGDTPNNGAAMREGPPSLQSGNGGTDVASQPEVEADPDLEAYLRDLSGEAQDGPGTPAGSDTPGGSDDGDFDKYLQELNKEEEDDDDNGGGGGGSNGGDEQSNSSEAADLDDYINTLQHEDDAEPGSK